MSLDSTKQTLKVTKQRGIRNAANPSPSRRFRTNGCQLRHPLDAKTVTSKRVNKCAQIPRNKIRLARCLSLKTKSEAHEVVSTLFAREGVPNAMVMDRAKEQTLGGFWKKWHKASCHTKQTTRLRMESGRC